MKPLLVAVQIALVWAPLAAQTSLQEELRQAWWRDPAVAPADWADQEAALALEAIQRSWWPVVGLDSPSLIGVSADKQTSTLSGGVSVTVAQKLPGGGAVTAGVTESLSKPLAVLQGGGATDLTSTPLLTLALSQPLAPGLMTAEGDLADLRATDDRLIARLVREKTLSDLWITVVRRAANLDAARATLTAREAALVAAQARATLASTWEAQGRATKTEAWKAAREADSARWLRDKAVLNLEVHEQNWTRWAGSPAGAWPLDQVSAWARALRIDRPSLDDQIAEVKARRATRTALVEQAGWAPIFSASTTARKPDGQPWSFSGQVGLKWTTDALVGAPLAAQRADLAQNRQAFSDQQAADDRAADRRSRESQEARTTAYQRLLEAELERQATLVSETRELVTGRRLPEADLTDAEADFAQLQADHRQLLWDMILFRLE